MNDQSRSLDGLVRDFHHKFEHPIAEGLNAAYHRNRADWIEEELKEYRDAIEAGDLTGQLDALGDLIYFATGSAVALGYRMDPIVREIHRSNMTKLLANGRPNRRADGKILKGPDYDPPNIHAALVPIFGAHHG